MFKDELRHKVAPPVHLNITSLMDILTIVLLFLIVSFSTQEEEVKPSVDITLPRSTAKRSIHLTVKVSVSKSAVMVEDTVVASLIGGRLSPGELDSKGRVLRLLKNLRKERAKLLASAPVSGREKDDDDVHVIFLEAEKGTPFSVIDQVLRTSAEAGFSKFRLAVVRKN
ncbi:biopolymer transporter ExbD [Myxococcota bacterium]|nr:biopolymer transporter ExbD [Myxococcota bacterium]